MTVKASVLQVLIDNHPLVPIHKVHHASEEHPFSGSQRLRDLRKEHGLSYEYLRSEKAYQVHTKKAELKKILKGLAA